MSTITPLEGGWQLNDGFLEHVSSDAVHSGGYEIAFSRLLELGRNDGYNWPTHMALKTWCDGRVFFRCWLAACAAAGHSLDPDRLLKTFAHAFTSKTSPRQDAYNAENARRIAAGETIKIVDAGDLRAETLKPRPGWLD